MMIASGVLAAVVLLFIVVLAVTAPSPAVVQIHVEVAADDPAMTVAVDGTFRRLSEFREPLELEPGEHEVIVRRGQKVLATHPFRVVRGVNPDVTVSVGRTPARNAAERVLSLGGTLTIVTDGASQRIEAVSQFPLEPFEIQDVVLTGCGAVTDADIRAVARLGTIRRFDLSGTPITDASVFALARLQHLTELNLTDTLVSDAGIVQLNTSRELRRIALDRTRVTDNGAVALAGLPELIELSLSGTALSDGGLESLGGLHSLAVLRVTETQVTEPAIERFQAAHPDCRVEHDPFVNPQEQAVARWVLECGGSVTIRLGDVERPIAAVAALPADGYVVARIDLSGASWGGDDALTILSTAAGLERLDLSGTDLSDSGLEQLGGLEPLKSLNIRRTSVQGGGLAVLATLPNLEELSLTAARIGSEHIVALAMAPAVERLVLEDAQVTAELAATLGTLPSLTSLALPGSGLTDVECSSLATLKRLKSLDVSDAAQLTDAGVASLLALDGLEELNLSGTQVSNATAAALAALPHLERVDLTRTPVTHQAIAALKRALPACQVAGGRMGTYDMDLSQVAAGELPPGWVGSRSVALAEEPAFRAIVDSSGDDGELRYPELRLDDDFYVELEICNTAGDAAADSECDLVLLDERGCEHRIRWQRGQVIFAPRMPSQESAAGGGTSPRASSADEGGDAPFSEAREFYRGTANASPAARCILRIERRGPFLRGLLDGLPLEPYPGRPATVPIGSGVEFRGVRFVFHDAETGLSRFRIGPLGPEHTQAPTGKTAEYTFTASRTNAKSGHLPPNWMRLSGTAASVTRLQVAPLEIAGDFAIEFETLAFVTAFQLTLTTEGDSPDLLLHFECSDTGAWTAWLPGPTEPQSVVAGDRPGTAEFRLERIGRSLSVLIHGRPVGRITLSEPAAFNGLLFDVDGATLRIASLRIRPPDR